MTGDRAGRWRAESDDLAWRLFRDNLQIITVPKTGVPTEDWPTPEESHRMVRALHAADVSSAGPLLQVWLAAQSPSHPLRAAASAAVTPCKCYDCAGGCDQYADADEELCIDCLNGEHVQDRGGSR